MVMQNQNWKCSFYPAYNNTIFRVNKSTTSDNDTGHNKLSSQKNSIKVIKLIKQCTRYLKYNIVASSCEIVVDNLSPKKT